LLDEKYTHDLRRIVAEESAKSSFDEVVELIEKRTGGSVPKRQVEELTVRSAQDFDAFYSDRLCEPEVTDDLLVLSFDGQGIAMRHEDLREATRKAAEAESKLHTRLAKGEKPNDVVLTHPTEKPSWRSAAGTSSSDARSGGTCCAGYRASSPRSTAR